MNSDLRPINFKRYHMIYISGWVLFVFYTTWGLHNENGSVLLVAFGYWMTYTFALFYESHRMVKALKNCNPSVAMQLQTSFLQNPFKWRKTLTNLNSGGAVENEILKNINALMLIHVMNIGTFFIIPVMLHIVSIIWRG